MTHSTVFSEEPHLPTAGRLAAGHSRRGAGLGALLLTLALPGPGVLAKKPAQGSSPAIDAIALAAHLGAAPEEMNYHIKQLYLAFGEGGPLRGEALSDRISAVISRSAGPQHIGVSLRDKVEEGRRAFIEGDYRRAVTLLREVRERLRDRVATIASDQAFRETLYRALIFSAHALLRAGEAEEAKAQLQEAIRAFPSRQLSLLRHSPDLVQFYKQVRKELQAKKVGTIRVVTEPPGCLVFVDERFVGVSPATAEKLPPGEYRVYVQRGSERGRVHDVNVRGSEEEVAIDFTFDTALVTQPTPALQYASARLLRRHELEHATRIAGRLGHRQVVLLRPIHRGEARVLSARLISVADRRVLRETLLRTGPEPPPREAYPALAAFLRDGTPSPHLVIAKRPVQPKVSGDGGLWSSGLWRWVTAGAAAAAIGAGVGMFVLDGHCQAERTPGGSCRDRYSTKVMGIGLVAGGALLGGLSTYLFISHATAEEEEPPRRALLAPWIAPRALGLTTAVTF